MYKIIKKDGKQLCSSWVTGEAQVTYVKGKWMKAPEWLAGLGYHLLVYKTLEEAVEDCLMLNFMCSCEIWKCRVKGIIKNMPPAGSTDKLAHGHLYAANFYRWPVGTVMVQSLKLTKKVLV